MPTTESDAEPVFYQILLVIGYLILLGEFKMGDDILDQSRLGAIFVGNGMDGDFILDYIHEFLVELQMGHLRVLL